MPRIAACKLQAVQTLHRCFAPDASFSLVHLETPGAWSLNETEVVPTDLPSSDYGLEAAFQSELLRDFFPPKCNQSLLKWAGMPKTCSASFLKPK